MREDQGLADRGTFLVDPDGIIQFGGDPPPRGSAGMPESLLNKVKAAQYVRAIIRVKSARRPGKRVRATLAPSLRSGWQDLNQAEPLPWHPNRVPRHHRSNRIGEPVAMITPEIKQALKSATSSTMQSAGHLGAANR